MLNKNIFFQLYFSRLRITFEASEPLELPVFKGSAFRGCFGQAFKREVCTFRKGLCEECKHKYDCSFSVLFNSYEFSEKKIGRELTKQPHPYLIVAFEDDRTNYDNADQFGFEITLIGLATRYVDSILNTIKKMGEYGIGKGRKQFKPVTIEVLNKSLVYENLSYLGQLHKIRLEDIPTIHINEDLNVRLDTPLRLARDSKPNFDIPDFKHFIESLLTRLTFLSSLYCDYENCNSELKEKWLSDTDQIMVTMNDRQLLQQIRYSGTQKSTMQFDGIIGTINFQGPHLSKWLPLLLMGSFLHVGSTTTFGLGKYTIIVE